MYVRGYIYTHVYNCGLIQMVSAIRFPDATRPVFPRPLPSSGTPRVACNTLQHTASHYITLYHTATYCINIATNAFAILRNAYIYICLCIYVYMFMYIYNAQRGEVLFV